MAQNEYLVNGADMTTVADAIREKGGTTAPLSFPEGMAAAVRGIQSGSGAAQTWYMNANLDSYAPEVTFTAVLTSNGKVGAGIKLVNQTGTEASLEYIGISDVGGVDLMGSGDFEWIDQAYRTVVFHLPPTGALLEWLKRNATPVSG